MNINNGTIKSGPLIEVRIQPNLIGSHWCWSINSQDGTKANGYANSAGDAMHNAAAFVEAMSQPRLGGMWKKQELRVVGGAEANND